MIEFMHIFKGVYVYYLPPQIPLSTQATEKGGIKMLKDSPTTSPDEQSAAQLQMKAHPKV